MAGLLDTRNNLLTVLLIAAIGALGVGLGCPDAADGAG